MQRDTEPRQVGCVVHVTEAFASGTLEAMRRMIASQSELGVEIRVIHSARPDSPPAADWDLLFPQSVSRCRVRPGSKLRELWELAAGARDALRKDPQTVVHVHSSLAAAALRLRLLCDPIKRRVLYSPHGFAFLRQDISRSARRVLYGVEKFLAHHCGGLMLVSQSEAELAQEWIPADRVNVVENAVDLSSMRLTAEELAPSESARQILTVVTMGRVTYQKAPWKFAALASALEHRAEFVWIGDGLAEDRQKWLDAAPVTVTGWLNRDEVIEQLRHADLFVLASLWEGMPLALIEAQCLGLPAVASNIVGNRDVICDGSSGLLADTDKELGAQVSRLLDDAGLRRTMARGALKQRDRFDQRRLGRQTMDIYNALLTTT